MQVLPSWTLHVSCRPSNILGYLWGGCSVSPQFILLPFIGEYPDGAVSEKPLRIWPHTQVDPSALKTYLLPGVCCFSQLSVRIFWQPLRVFLKLSGAAELASKKHQKIWQIHNWCSLQNKRKCSKKTRPSQGNQTFAQCKNVWSSESYGEVQRKKHQDLFLWPVQKVKLSPEIWGGRCLRTARLISRSKKVKWRGTFFQITPEDIPELVSCPTGKAVNENAEKETRIDAECNGPQDFR